MKADLHLHSTHSDGTLTPTELVALCANAGLEVIALTDHDAVDGLGEAIQAGRARGIKVLPAIELSAGNDPEIHILGYFPDISDSNLHAWLAQLRAERDTRAEFIVERLCEMGASISLDAVRAEAGSAALGRVHVARALIAGGYANSVSDAFERLLRPGKPGYVEKKNPSVEHALQRMREFGMTPVLAHGALLDAPPTWILGLIDHAVEHGLMGLECFHTGYDRAMENFMLGIAKEKRLLVTGGSDFHGANRPRVQPGDGMARWRDRGECVEALFCSNSRSNSYLYAIAHKE